MATTTVSALSPSGRTGLVAEVVKLLAVVVAALGVVVLLRDGLAGPAPLATAATTATQLRVTGLEQAGVDGSRVRVTVDVENAAPEAVVVDDDWFRMMSGSHMVPVLDAGDVPATRVEGGESATFELEFAAPPAGETPRLEVTDTTGGVATLLLRPLTEAPAAPAAEAAHGAHG